MAILNSFYFDGISSWEQGLVIESKSILNGPEPRLQEWEVPGRDGAEYLFEGYRNVEVSYTTFLKACREEELPQRAGALKAWLLGKPGEYLRLEDVYDPDHYRLASYGGGLDFENHWKLFARQTAAFSCKPYRYLRAGENRLSSQMDSSGRRHLLTAFNPTGFASLPVVELYLGESFSGGAVDLQGEYEDGSVYEQTLTGIPVRLLGTVLYLDCERQLIRDSLGELVQSGELEEFPTLLPGKTQLTVSGSGLSGFGVVPRWREL